MKKKLRIGLIMQGGKDWIGGIQYIKNLIYALASLPQEIRTTFEICLICSKYFDLEEYNQISSYLDDVYYLESELAEFTLINRARWKFIRIFNKQAYPRFDEFINREKIDFLYPYFTNNKKTSYKSAAWIADFQHKYLTDFFPKEEIAQRDILTSLIAKQASTIVLSSKTAEIDFRKFFPEVSNKSKVLSFKTSIPNEYLDLNPIDTHKKYNLPDRFFIVCNQFWQHKNHIAIFKSLRLLQEQSVYPNIVCTGNLYDGRQPNYINTVLQSIHELGIAQQIYLLGLLPRSEQIQLIRCSIAIIQPSLFEGWSTVVEDARCLGKPMILSDIPVHLEQNPNYSIYFKHDSFKNLADVISHCWTNQSLQFNLSQELIERENNFNEVQKFGKSFLQIANEIIYS